MRGASPWDEETSGPLVGAANTRSHFASLVISPSLRSARSLTSIVYSSQNVLRTEELCRCSATFCPHTLLGAPERPLLRNDYAKAEHSFHLHISYLSNARSIIVQYECCYRGLPGVSARFRCAIAR